MNEEFKENVIPKLPDTSHLLTELEPIKKVITKIIGTAKRN